MTTYTRDEVFTFFGQEDLFSQWNWRGIVVKGKFFKTCEHFMMYCKAMLFGDEEIAEKILVTPNPRAAKKLGRKVRGFVQEVWDKKKCYYVTTACIAKAEQYPEVMELLKSTGNKMIIEASRYDGIWGVKLGKDDPRILDDEQWQGLNLLGWAWMAARTIFIVANWDLKR